MTMSRTKFILVLIALLVLYAPVVYLGYVVWQDHRHMVCNAAYGQFARLVPRCQ